MRNHLQSIFAICFFSSNIFSISCQTLAENSIPAVPFSSTMQFEFRQKLSSDLLNFDNLSDFSQNFIGTPVTQKNIDVAMRKAFEIFGRKIREVTERNQNTFELKNIEKIADQEKRMKAILIDVVRKRQN